jgi:hypothetical protein
LDIEVERLIRESIRMETNRLVIPGIVKGGVVVPQSESPLPEGAHVDIVIAPAEVTAELKAEFDRWEQASDESWQFIEQWEKANP